MGSTSFAYPAAAGSREGGQGAAGRLDSCTHTVAEEDPDVNTHTHTYIYKPSTYLFYKICNVSFIFYTSPMNLPMATRPFPCPSPLPGVHYPHAHEDGYDSTPGRPHLH